MKNPKIILTTIKTNAIFSALSLVYTHGVQAYNFVFEQYKIKVGKHLSNKYLGSTLSFHCIKFQRKIAENTFKFLSVSINKIDFIELNFYFAQYLGKGKFSDNKAFSFLHPKQKDLLIFYGNSIYLSSNSI